ncbi:hypothetical protein L9G16_23085, partial [Shewanella sp. A25]|nr:hypothetical protein [Shewanella shenzhenensis]
MEPPERGVAGAELLEDEEPRGRGAWPGGGGGEVGQAAEVRGGDDVGERARDGADAEEFREGEADEDVVE